MNFRLVLNYENISHRFVSTTKVTLTLDGAAQTEAQGSQLGRNIWDLTANDGQKLVLNIQIPAPINSGLSGPLFQLNQPLDIKADANAVRLVPNQADNHWQGFLNPRLSAQWVGAGVGQRLEMNCDLTFLDVTDYFQALTHDPAFPHKGQDGFDGFDLYNKMQPINPIDSKTGFRLPPDPPQHYATRLRLLEFTGGQAVTWAVVIPKAVTASSKLIHSLLFYRPNMADKYTNTDDLRIRDMLRYMGDQTPENTPFFTRDPSVSGGSSWDPYPECSWERQIDQCGKCFLFVHPFPHGGIYGEASGTNFPKLLASLCKILWADQNISTSVLSAFSRGGEALYSALKKNPNKIDELYLFDPLSTDTNQSRIVSWFQKGGKKLRMFGGVYAYPTMLGLAAQLKSADVSIRPSSRSDWSGFGSMYRLAVLPIKNGKRRTLLLVNDPETDAVKREISDQSQIFYVRDGSNGSVVIEAALSSGKRVQRTIPDCGREEIAAFLTVTIKVALHHTVLTKPTKDPSGKLQPAGTLMVQTGLGPLFYKPEFIPVLPMTTEADVDHNVNVFIHGTKDVRHQWAVVGGDDFNLDLNRGRTFSGFLEQALKQSSFT
jgi:hypothetical protein